MISVEEARQRVLAGLVPLPTEVISIAEANGRVLAADVIAQVTQPPRPLSAMDGYAVRAADVAEVPVQLTQVGEAPAGGSYDKPLQQGETVRIFTGGPLPEGADAVIIQEDSERDESGPQPRITLKEKAFAGKYVRPRGLDFTEGEVCLEKGTRLNPGRIGFVAAMGVPWVTVYRKPRIAILSTGDELMRPGEKLGSNQIYSSNALSLAALVRAEGGEAIDLGIARDDEASLRSLAAGVKGADMLVTIGGASVGDHDLVREVLGDGGLSLDFWRIAMRPGKPLMFGMAGDVPLMGMPGNPVSSMVCGLLFLVPAMKRLSGLAETEINSRAAHLGRDLGENDQREDYLRSSLHRDDEGRLIATPFEKQDSSMLSVLAKADCLLIRAPHAPAAKAGEMVSIIPIFE